LNPELLLFTGLLDTSATLVFTCSSPECGEPSRTKAIPCYECTEELKTYTGEQGKKARVFTTTMGAATDLQAVADKWTAIGADARRQTLDAAVGQVAAEAARALAAAPFPAASPTLAGTFAGALRAAGGGR
jgi:hypothetical protein